MEKHRVDEYESFEKYTSINMNFTNLDVYIEKQLLNEVSNHNIIIDAHTWSLFGKLKGSLFMNFI